MTIQSCIESKKRSMPFSLSGKVYLLSDSIENIKCEAIPVGTDYWPTYLFINDSVFIKVIHNCCAPTTETYFSGTYKLNENELNLIFDPNQIVYYYAFHVESSDTVLNSLERIEVNKIPPSRDSLERIDCNKHPYFKQRIGDWENRYIAMNEDTIEKHINSIMDKKIWEKLFIKK